MTDGRALHESSFGIGLGWHVLGACLILILGVGSVGCEKHCPSGYGRVGDTCRPVVPADGAGAPAAADAGGPEREGDASAARVGTRASGVEEMGGSSAKASSEVAGQGGDRASGGQAAASDDAAAEEQSGTGDGAAEPPADAGAPAASNDPASDSATAAEETGPCTGRADESVCDGAVLHQCDGAGESASAETCMNEALCQIGSSSAACAQCAPGTFLCEGAQLKECSGSGQWADKQQCATEALCKETAGACTEMVCTPNAKTCDASGNLLTCNASGSDFAKRDACGVGLCDAEAGRCNRCMPGTKSCQGDRVVTCSDDGQSESEEACAPRNDCWTAACTGGACRELPKRASTRCEGDGYCDGAGECVGCTSDAHCSALNDECSDGRCQDGTCRAVARQRGERCRSGAGLCDRGTCSDVECLSASDCGSGASCVEGECVACGDRKIGPGEECDIGAPKKPGDQLSSAAYDEYSCDARCKRLYLYTPCSTDSGQSPSSACGGQHRCNGQICIPSAGCNGDGTCTLPNGLSGTCYGNACFRTCVDSGDCPSNLTCDDWSPGRFCA